MEVHMTGLSQRKVKLIHRLWNFRHHFQYAVYFPLPCDGLLKSLDADRLTTSKPVYKGKIRPA